MKKLLNTLYVTSENSYLSLDGENVVVLDDKTEIGRLPLHNLEGIVSFGYRGTSPALMGACAERGSMRSSPAICWRRCGIWLAPGRRWPPSPGTPLISCSTGSRRSPRSRW